MTEEQRAHLDRVVGQITSDLRAKYEAGQESHGGDLWRKPGMLEAALEEVLDLAIYLYTLREQRDGHTRITGRDV